MTKNPMNSIQPRQGDVMYSLARLKADPRAHTPLRLAGCGKHSLSHLHTSLARALCC